MKAFLPDMGLEDNEKVPADCEISLAHCPGDGKMEE
jgi:hypothetical protein